MPEHALPLFVRPPGFVYQYVFDIFCSSHLTMNLGDWKEERPDVAQPFDTPDAHFILSQERFFHVDQEDQWPLAQDYLRKAIRQLRRAHLPDEGVLAIVHRCDYVGLVWSEEPVRPNVRGPGPYLSDDWYGAPTWWNP